MKTIVLFEDPAYTHALLCEWDGKAIRPMTQAECLARAPRVILARTMRCRWRSMTNALSALAHTRRNYRDGAGPLAWVNKLDKAAQ